MSSLLLGLLSASMALVAAVYWRGQSRDASAKAEQMFISLSLSRAESKGRAERLESVIRGLKDEIAWLERDIETCSLRDPDMVRARLRRILSGETVYSAGSGPVPHGIAAGGSGSGGRGSA